MSRAEPSHLTAELKDSSAARRRVSLPSSAYDICAPPVEHRMAPRSCEIVSAFSTSLNARIRLATWSSTHLPEKSRSGLAARSQLVELSNANIAAARRHLRMPAA